MMTSTRGSPEYAAGLQQADFADRPPSGEDLKSLLTQLCEEVHFLRMTKKESEERMRHLVRDQHKHERHLEAEILKNSSLKEKHEQELADLDRSYQEEMKNLNREKSKLVWENESWERDVKSVKDEVRSLQLEKYNLERLIREQSHLLKTQTALGDSHQRQAATLEDSAKGLRHLAEQCNSQIAGLTKEVKEATALNERLSFINAHHRCVERDLEVTLEEKERVISELEIARKVVKVGAVDSAEQQGEHDVVLLQERVEKMVNSEDVSKKQLEQSRKRNQEMTKQLEETQRLLETYLAGNQRYRESAERLEKERDEMAGELERKGKSMEQDVSRLDQEKEDLERTSKEKIDTMEEQIHSLKSEVEATEVASQILQDENKSLQDKHTKMLSAVSSLQEELNQRNKLVVDAATNTEESAPESREALVTVSKVTVGKNTGSQEQAEKTKNPLCQFPASQTVETPTTAKKIVREESSTSEKVTKILQGDVGAEGMETSIPNRSGSFNIPATSSRMTPPSVGPRGDLAERHLTGRGQLTNFMKDGRGDRMEEPRLSRPAAIEISKQGTSGSVSKDPVGNVRTVSLSKEDDCNFPHSSRETYLLPNKIKADYPSTVENVSLTTSVLTTVNTNVVKGPGMMMELVRNQLFGDRGLREDGDHSALPNPDNFINITPICTASNRQGRGAIAEGASKLGREDGKISKSSADISQEDRNIVDLSPPMHKATSDTMDEHSSISRKDILGDNVGSADPGDHIVLYPKGNQQESGTYSHRDADPGASKASKPSMVEYMEGNIGESLRGSPSVAVGDSGTSPSLSEGTRKRNSHEKTDDIATGSRDMEEGKDGISGDEPRSLLASRSVDGNGEETNQAGLKIAEEENFQENVSVTKGPTDLASIERSDIGEAAGNNFDERDKGGMEVTNTLAGVTDETTLKLRDTAQRDSQSGVGIQPTEQTTFEGHLGEHSFLTATGKEKIEAVPEKAFGTDVNSSVGGKDEAPSQVMKAVIPVTPSQSSTRTSVGPEERSPSKSLAISTELNQAENALDMATPSSLAPPGIRLDIMGPGAEKTNVICDTAVPNVTPIPVTSGRDPVKCQEIPGLMVPRSNTIGGLPSPSTFTPLFPATGHPLLPAFPPVCSGVRNMSPRGLLRSNTIGEFSSSPTVTPLSSAPGGLPSSNTIGEYSSSSTVIPLSSATGGLLKSPPILLYPPPVSCQEYFRSSKSTVSVNVENDCQKVRIPSRDSAGSSQPSIISHGALSGEVGRIDGKRTGHSTLVPGPNCDPSHVSPSRYVNQTGAEDFSSMFPRNSQVFTKENAKSIAVGTSSALLKSGYGLSTATSQIVNSSSLQGETTPGGVLCGPVPQTSLASFRSPLASTLITAPALRQKELSEGPSLKQAMVILPRLPYLSPPYRPPIMAQQSDVQDYQPVTVQRDEVGDRHMARKQPDPAGGRAEAPSSVLQYFGRPLSVLGGSECAAESPSGVLQHPQRRPLSFLGGGQGGGQRSRDGGPQLGRLDASSTCGRESPPAPEKSLSVLGGSECPAESPSGVLQHPQRRPLSFLGGGQGGGQRSRDGGPQLGRLDASSTCGRESPPAPEKSLSVLGGSECPAESPSGVLQHPQRRPLSFLGGGQGGGQRSRDGGPQLGRLDASSTCSRESPLAPEGGCEQPGIKEELSCTVEDLSLTSLKRPASPDPDMSLFSEDEDDISSSLNREIIRAQNILNRSRLKRLRRCKAPSSDEIGQGE